MDLSLERIEEAASAIDSPLLNTPQFVDPVLCGALGREVVVKMENVSPLGSFKGRGAGYFVGRLDRRDEHRVTATAGTWGIGLAYAGRRHGHRVDIFAPASAAAGKVRRMRAVDASVSVVEGGPDEVHAAARVTPTVSQAVGWSPMASLRRSPRARHDRDRASPCRDARRGRRPGRRRRPDQRHRTLAESTVSVDARHRRLRERRAGDEAEHRCRPPDPQRGAWERPNWSAALVSKPRD